MGNVACLKGDSWMFSEGVGGLFLDRISVYAIVMADLVWVSQYGHHRHRSLLAPSAGLPAL